MRAVTLTLHPAIDRVVSVERLQAGKTFDAELLLQVPAGKGVNTARALRAVCGPGSKVIAAVWAGEAGAREFAAQLRQLSPVLPRLCRRPCATRAATTIFEHSGCETHIKEAMDPPRPEDERRLLDFWRKLLRPGDCAAVCGSAPGGTSSQTLRQIFRIARERRAAAIIADTNGPALGIAGASGLDGIKGNAAEIGAWLGLKRPLDPRAASHRCVLARALQGRHAPRRVLVTLGAQGAVLASPEGLWAAEPPPAARSRKQRGFQSATGCGDAATAGWLWALMEHCTDSEAVRRAVMCGTAKLNSPDPGHLDSARVRALHNRVTLARLCDWR